MFMYIQTHACEPQVCCLLVRVWALDVWGELDHQRSLTHHSQFSRLGIQCPTFIYVMFGRSGLNEVGFFLKIPIWLVCYAHGFHVISVQL